MIKMFITGEEKFPTSQRVSQDRDSFHVRGDEFILPDDTWKLDPQTKRAMTICNLFVNHRYGILNIVRALDEDCRNVVSVLLKKGIIRDRRLRQRRPPEGIERRKTIVSPIDTLRTPKKTILNSDTKFLESSFNLEGSFGRKGSLLLSDDHPGDFIV